ncbi:efflux RND transporter periplasmic adaptor subunit [Wenxinia marina]|uniref:RND family efflux transporter, MFP subunit n=1 Tax=Wenxinia marina DSM 24838 TaxID=1123501 RepID=A0A0D0Q430_9RHOB|nr:efflux RND transporter periplasmic adaptor subunit [Wenxinia marina]KIQ69264.1 RND family efflux transporter, MFP subunit [Wenxinia marina DSM 24838]GGL71639.1 hypothetical protein GCM10011392_27810 [Wenxinia marina]
MVRAVGTLLTLAAALAAAPALAQEAHDCVIDPSLVVDVAGPSGGIIAEVRVEPGDEVAKGDVIARLDSTVEEATVALLDIRANDDSAIRAERSRLDFLEMQLARTEELQGRGVVTSEALEEVRSSVEASRSLLAQAELSQRVAAGELLRARAALSLLDIRSPIDGIATARELDPGEYLPQEGRVATVVQLDPLEVVAFLPVEIYGSIAIGDTATVNPASPVEGTYFATVSRIDRVFDVASGTFGIVLTLGNPDLSIPAGLRCTLSFVTDG